MNFIKKIFSKFKSNYHKPKNENNNLNYNLKWINPEENQWGIKVLDLRPISQTMLSFTENPLMSENALSYSLEDGISFILKKPLIDLAFQTELLVPIDKKLEEGVLFIPERMEHKWAIFYRENKIIIVRSWRREVFIIAKTYQNNNKLVITEIHGKFIYEEEPESYTKATLLFLLHSHCLKENVPIPIPEDLIFDTSSAGIWVFQNFGNLADFGYVGTDFNYQTDSYLKSHTLLHMAVKKENIAEIDKYISAGIDINISGVDGATPLHWAIHVNISTLKYLIAKKANVNVTAFDGTTPLMSASQENKPLHLETLIINGADVNMTDNRGFTALHRSSEIGALEITKILIKSGADKNIIAQNHTPLSLAKARNNKKIIKLLQ